MGKGSYNDTFAMTRKDEELLVGAILQKIVVPHPAVTHLEAIEVSEQLYFHFEDYSLIQVKDNLYSYILFFLEKNTMNKILF